MCCCVVRFEVVWCVVWSEVVVLSLCGVVWCCCVLLRLVCC